MQNQKRRLFASDVIGKFPNLRTAFELIQGHFPEHVLVLMPRPNGTFTCGCDLPVEIVLGSDEQRLQFCPIHKVP